MTLRRRQEYEYEEPPADELIRRLTLAQGWIAAALGVVIILCHIESGPRRWSAPAWRGALIVPGAPGTWGVVILIAGTVLLVAARAQNLRLFYAGAWLGFFWFVAIGAWQVVTILFHDPEHKANPIFLPMWIFCAWLLMSSIRHAQREGKRGG